MVFVFGKKINCGKNYMSGHSGKSSYSSVTIQNSKVEQFLNKCESFFIYYQLFFQVFYRLQNKNKKKIFYYFYISHYLSSTISYNSLPQVFQIRSLRFIKVLLCSTWFEKFSSKLLFWEVVSCGKLVSFVNNSTTTLGPQIVQYE